jgi:plasmid stabilization system protein ParE
MKKELNLLWDPKAELSIFIISEYISEEGYPLTASKFANELYDFGLSLILFPKKYPLCKNPILFYQEIRCTVYRKNYIFLYKIIHDDLLILNVIHASRLV